MSNKSKMPNTSRIQVREVAFVNLASSISGDTILVKRDSPNASDLSNYSDKISIPNISQDYNEPKGPQFKSDKITKIDEVENLKQLEAAEMELEFLKDQLDDNKIIALKGNKRDEIGQCYWGRISIMQLKRKLPRMENSGINFVEIYMRAMTDTKQ